jgi:hypothetical protein
MTHASTVQIDDAPEAVIRYKQGYCGQCWDRMQIERPMTQQEIRAKETLEAWLSARRKRLARKAREREQFNKTPIFGTLEVQYSEGPPPEGEPKAYELPKPKTGYQKVTLEHYVEGSIDYKPFSERSWGYEIRDPQDVIIAKNDYGYISIKQARNAARREAAKLEWDMSLRIGQRQWDRMSKVKRREIYGR